MNPQLLALAIAEAPAIIAYLKIQFHTQRPEAVLPSDDEIIKAYESAFRSSLAKDSAWLAAHPKG